MQTHGVLFDMELILASGSPRRRKFLEEIGLSFEVLPSNEDEVIDPSMTPAETVKALALAKAANILKRRPSAAVLAADSVVVFGGKIIGKPKDAIDAKRILKALSGKKHEVMTGIAFLIGGRTYSECAVSEVWFNDLTDEFIDNYVATGSPLDKAGAYGIQDGGIVKTYRGSYTNIIGLPMERVTEILRAEKFLPEGENYGYKSRD